MNRGRFGALIRWQMTGTLDRTPASEFRSTARFRNFPRKLSLTAAQSRFPGSYPFFARVNNRIAMNIPYHRPDLSDIEAQYLLESLETGKLSGDHQFTKRCHRFLEEIYGKPV